MRKFIYSKKRVTEQEAPNCFNEQRILKNGFESYNTKPTPRVVAVADVEGAV